MSRSVLVVGAGPAGIASALTLNKHGHTVTVLDKAKFPRDKCCGDGLTTGALRLLEQLGLVPDMVPDWHQCDSAWLRSPSGREILLPLPSDGGQFAAIAPRLQLDNALVVLARSRGINILENISFESVLRNDSDCVEIQTSGGPMTADFVIAADGMWSPVRRALGLSTPSYLGEWHAFRQYLGNVTGLASTQLCVWFEPDLLPGYAWSFPLPDNRVNFGFGVLRTSDHSVQYMNSLWQELPTRAHIVGALGPDVTFLGRHTAWPIPARIDTATRSSGRVLFVGDAVCATDTLTGEGIGQALLTGILAADVINSGATPRDVRDAYSRALDQDLLADHRMSQLLGRILARPIGARAALRVADTSAWTRRNFARWMFEDEPRAVLLTPRRWHRKFFARSGAFDATHSPN